VRGAARFRYPWTATTSRLNGDLSIRLPIRTLLHACVALSAVLAAPTGAQIMSNPGRWYINPQLYSTRVFIGVIADSMLDATRGQAGAAPRNTTPDVMRFRPASAPIAPARFAAHGGGTPEVPREAQAEYESRVALYARTADTDGFPADDLAYAYEYFIVNADHVHHDLVPLQPDRDPYLRHAVDGFDRIALAAHKRTEKILLAQERALYEQFRHQLGASPEVGRMSDAEKQESAEMLAISFGVTYSAYLRCVENGDAALYEAARRAARTGLEKLLGRPIEKISIGYSGLQPDRQP